MVTAIIQARMGATRLPGKPLMEVCGKPLLYHQLERVKRAKTIDQVVVATTENPQDDEIVAFCEQNKYLYFRGDENDVLTRYYHCAQQYQAKVIVRLTGDCPLVDPEIIDDTVRLFKEARSDFSANTVPPETSCFPDGSDVEVFSMEALQRAYDECENPHDREHVTFYFWKYSNGFSTSQLKSDIDRSKYRITVDYPEDFKVIQYVFDELARKKMFGTLEEIIAILDCNKTITDLNSNYYFGIGWEQKRNSSQ